MLPFKEERLSAPIFSKNHLIALLLFLLITVLITLIRAQHFGGSGIPKSLDVNNDCNLCVNAAQQESYCIQLPYQYPKVIWFITDGNELPFTFHI